MKKSIIKKISLSLACLLGIGGFVGVAISKDKEAVEAKAETQTETLNLSAINSYFNNPKYHEHTNVSKSLSIGTWTLDGYCGQSGSYLEFGIAANVTTTNITFTKASNVVVESVSIYGYVAGMADGKTASASFNGSSLSVVKTQTSQGTDTSYCRTHDTCVTFSITCNNTGVDFQNFSITINYSVQQKVDITSGTGISSVYTSETINATSGKSSGSYYEVGKTVYAFAVLKNGYSAPSGWTLVSGTAGSEGAIYRVGLTTIASRDYYFGTISDYINNYSISYQLDGGTSSGNPTSYTVETETFTINNPTKEGYTFTGWSGTDLVGEDNLNVSIAKGNTGDRSYTAHWLTSIIQYEVSGTEYIHDGNPHTITGIIFKDGVTGEVITPNVLYSGNEGATYELTDAPTFIEGGIHKIYYKATLEGHATLYGEIDVAINVAAVINGATTTYYSSFADALSHWDDGYTLTLYEDVTTSSTITITGEQTINLNSHGIKASSSGYSVITVNDGGNLTITDAGNTTHYFTVDREVNGAGFATICDEATYNAAAENARGTFQGGYITGGIPSNPTDNPPYYGGGLYVAQGGTATLIAGTIIGNNATNGAGGISSNGTLFMNGGNVIYNRGRRGSGILISGGNFTMNGGSIEYNTAWDTINCGIGALLTYESADSISLNGGSISHNFARYAGIDSNTNISLSGDLLITDNIACGDSGTGTSRVNIRLPQGKYLSGYSTNETPIGVGIKKDAGVGNTGVFTNNTDHSYSDPSKFVSNDGSHVVGKNAAGQLLLGSPITVTYDENGHGDTPEAQIIASGGVITNPPTPSVGGYDFLGWYKEAECENAWDFATDAVSGDTTLYAKWEIDSATANVIKLINDIGDLTYDGGVDDSLDDIIAAKAAYDALTPEQKEVVDGVNGDVLEHDLTVYKHVDKVGDLIKAIPEASDNKEYYDAIDLAKAEYDKLTDEEINILNTDIDFNYKKVLDDNLKAKEVIEIINKIGPVTYKGGTDDSKDDIENAEKIYNELTPEQKVLVNRANHDDLEESRETYNKVDDAVNKINSIGDITHGGDKDSKDDIDAARSAYDKLTPEQKELVKGYNNSYTELDDAEHVYTALEKIDAIGDISYSSESKEAIEEARRYYDSLTDEQKEKVGREPYRALTDAEVKYEEVDNTSTMTSIIALVVSILLLIAGLVVLYILLKKKKDNDDNDKNGNSKELKLASITPFSLLIFINFYTTGLYLALYIIIGLTILVWLTDLTIFILKKKGIIPKSKEVEEEKVTHTPNDNNEESEEEVVTVTDEKGNIFQIRFIKSFTAKLIQSPDETKKYYEELKNEVLSYKKTNSRVSWHYDSVNAGRNQVLKFAIRGKTLCVYYPLNADDYLDTKYKVEKVESKKYEEVPCMYRIKNDRRLAYAKDLIKVVCESLGLVKGEEQHEVYANLPYEANKPLIARGLIKELKVQVNKPQVIETKVNKDGDEIVIERDAKGNIFEIRFVKSFTAKLIQSPEETKKYYEELKNYVLSYKKTTSRISWHYDSINSGRNFVLKFAIRGKTLCLYYPLNADNYIDTKYKVEKVESKKFEDVPCLYRIKNDRRLGSAKDLIDTVMANLGLTKGEEQHEVYSNLPYEENKPLIARGLIKELKVQVNKTAEVVLETKTNADGDEIVTTRDNKGNIFEIRYIKSFTAKLSQSSDEVKDYYTELKNYALSYKKANSRVSWHYDSINVGRNQVIKFSIRGKTLCLYYALDADQYLDSKYKVEKVESKKYIDVPCLYRIKNDRRRDYAKDLIDVVMNNVPTEKGKESNEDYRIPFEETKALLAKGLIKEVKTKVNKVVEEAHEAISVQEADIRMSDEVAESKIEEDTTSKKHIGKKGIINIDTIGDNFSNGDIVDIEALWKKKLIPSNVGYVKVLARGSLDKKLTVNLQDYSIQAVKMILLSGGNVKKTK